MPVARFQMPDGRIARFEVPEGTTPEQAQQLISQQLAQQPIQEPPATEAPGIAGQALGALEAAGTVVSGALAEPVAGIAGIAQAINPFAAPGAGAEAVEATREALTRQPRTEAGVEALESVAGAVAPVAEVFGQIENTLGDKTLEATGSPALAALAKTIPTAIAETIGLSVGKGALKLKGVRGESEITRTIADAAPSVDQLKDASRAVYKEIDELGVTVKPKAYRRLVSKLSQEAKRNGLDPDITPKTARALNRLAERVGDNVTLTELDTLRKVAQGAASSIEATDAALGVQLINTIDEFLDTAGTAALKKPKGVVEGVGKRYKAARDLWGSARRSELLEESFEKARNQASGFENGIRTQFRSILNNKKKRRFFKKDEIEAMNKVVRGGTGENILKLLGRFGFSEGGATNIIGGALGVTAGAAALGTPGAVAVPVIGQVSRKLAQRLTVKNAEFADQVVRAGTSARKIVEAYLDNTPKAQRSASELSELLLKRDIDLSELKGSGLAKEAAKIASERRTLQASTLAGGTLAPQGEQ